MGRGAIVGHLGEGFYAVNIVADNAGIDKGIATATVEINVQTANIVALDDELAVLRADLLIAEAALNAAILSGDQSAIDTEVAEVAEITAQINIKIRTRNSATSRKFAAEKNKQYYQANRIDDSLQEVWAADLTEDLAGDVGLIELGRDGNEPSIIYPASEDGTEAEYDDQRDGTNQSPLSNTGSAAVWNYGVSLGVTKWKPRYRTGTITAIENGLADVSLDPYIREGVDMNVESVLLDVPVKYLNCDALAFLLTDPVIIEFTDQDWTQPRVIGFVNNPRRCTPRYYLFRASNYYTVWDFTTGALAEIVDPDTLIPIPLPATLAQISNWLNDHSVVPKDGDLFTRQPVDGIELTLTSTVEGPPLVCPTEPGDARTTLAIEYDGTSRAGVYSGSYTFDRTILDLCNTPIYLIEEEYDVEDFDPSLTFANLNRAIIVPALSNIRPSIYVVATIANNGAEHQFTTDYAGTYGGNSDSGSGSNFAYDWNGTVELVTAAPCGSISGIVDWEYVDWTRLVFEDPTVAGSRRIIQETESFTDVSFAASAAVQVYIELVRYDIDYGSGPIPDGYGSAVNCAADTYEGNATDIDPLTQTDNAAFTTIINDCLALGFNGTIVGTMTGQYLRG